MRNAELLRRESNERAAYSKVGSEGRSALSDDELIIPAETIARFECVLGRRQPARAPRTPLEQMVAWTNPTGGQRILEICCHTGEFGTILARLGAAVDSIDIAEPLVVRAKRRVELNGVVGRQRPVVMSAHDLQFADETFDVVFGKAALHHLDLGAARDEVYRVLKPGGMAVFSEPVVLSRTLRHLRERVPVPLDAETVDERPLTAADLAEFVRPFSGPRYRYFRVLGRLDRLMPSAEATLNALDLWLLEKAPALVRAADICDFVVTKPSTTLFR